MAELYKLSIRGHIAAFYSFISAPGWQARAETLRPFYDRMPDPHLAVLYPIFLVEEKPGGNPGGGTWARGTDWMRVVGGGRRAERTHVPDADLNQLIIQPSLGLTMIPRERWERPLAHLPTTIFHEVGHCIDNNLHLIPPGATDAEFAGMHTNVCGAGSARARQAVEAYARVLYNPARIFHELPPGETAASANARLLGALRRSPAFRSVPSSWPPALARHPH